MKRLFVLLMCISFLPSCEITDSLGSVGLPPDVDGLYSGTDKAYLRSFLSQGSLLAGELNGSCVGLSSLDISSDTDESWVIKLDTLLTWGGFPPRRLTGIYWSRLDPSAISMTGTLDLRGCTELRDLDIFNQRIHTLDISECSELTYLNCRSNELSSIDLSGSPRLETLICDNNHLLFLDLRACPLLSELRCTDNGMLDLYLCWETPPVTPSYSLDPSLCTLHVPLGSLPHYQSIYPWNRFATIVEWQ